MLAHFGYQPPERQNDPETGLGIIWRSLDYNQWYSRTGSCRIPAGARDGRKGAEQCR
jgi:hypothetical protein